MQKRFKINFNTNKDEYYFNKRLVKVIICANLNSLNFDSEKFKQICAETQGSLLEVVLIQNFDRPEIDTKDLDSVIEELDFEGDAKEQIKTSCLKIEKYRREYKKNRDLASLIKQNDVISDLNRLISIIDRANQLATGGKRLRLTQIVAILVFLNDKHSFQNLI